MNIRSWSERGAGPSRAVPPGICMRINSLETGGSVRQCAALAQALDSDRFRLHLGCIQKKGAFLHGLGEIPEFRLGGSVYGWRSLRSRLRLARYLRQKQIAVAHAFDFYANLSLIPAARLAGVPVVIGSHRQLGDLLTPLRFRAQNIILHMCDRIVCNSRAATALLKKSGVGEQKLTVIPNSLPDAAF